MQDLIAMLDAKEQEIHDFLKLHNDEREKLITRLNEIDRMNQEADHDLRRINKARNALRNPDEAQMMSDDISAMAVAPPRATPQYYPGR